MAGIPELLQQVLSLTTNVARQQSDLEKLEQQQEKLLEKHHDLVVKFEKAFAEIELAAVKEAGATAREASNSTQGAMMTALSDLKAEVRELQNSMTIVNQVPAPPSTEAPKLNDGRTDD